MTATRDDRGRFISADEHAANRLLSKAVAQAREVISSASEGEVRDWSGRLVAKFRDYDRAAVVTMLAEAGRSAELLLGVRDA